jgi:hypothetical protein
MTHTRSFNLPSPSPSPTLPLTSPSQTPYLPFNLSVTSSNFSPYRTPLSPSQFPPLAPLLLELANSGGLGLFPATRRSPKYINIRDDLQFSFREVAIYTFIAHFHLGRVQRTALHFSFILGIMYITYMLRA